MTKTTKTTGRATYAEIDRKAIEAAAKAAHKAAVAEGRICACEAVHGPHCGAR